LDVKRIVLILLAAAALLGNSPPMHTRPDVNLSWSSPEHTALHVELPARDSFMEQCIKSGSEGRYLYEFQLCRKRSFWPDDCLPTLQLVHSVRQEPISQSFIFVVDRIGDGAEGITTNYRKLETALQGLTRVIALPTQLLIADAEEAERYLGPRGYISVRVRSDCHGGYNRTLARIGYFLSFGLVKVSGFTTGWVDFELDSSMAR